jgi:hypothetical protein
VALLVLIRIFAVIANLILRANSYVVLVELEERRVWSNLGYSPSSVEKF